VVNVAPSANGAAGVIWSSSPIRSVFAAAPSTSTLSTVRARRSRSNRLSDSVAFAVITACPVMDLALGSYLISKA
jgi:hypothetical protein